MYGYLGYKVHPQKTYISRDRGEFLRRNYEPKKLTGYLGRTQLALRFRNPIIPLALDPAERLGSRMDLWSLFAIRGGNGRGVAEMFLEDAEQSGVKKEIAIGYALTPCCAGGLGLDKEDHPIGKELFALNGGGITQWVRPKTEKPLNRLDINWGKWQGRMDLLGIHLSGGYKEEFKLLLARTWGVPELHLVGEVHTEWECSEIWSPFSLTRQYTGIMSCLEIAWGKDS